MLLRKVPYYLLPLNVLFDVLLILFEGGGLLPFVRAGFMVALILVVLFQHGRHANHYGWLIVFALYCLVNVMFSHDFVRSLNITLKVLIPMLSFAIGFNLINTEGEIRKLNQSVLWVYVILLANYGISQTMGLGKSVYTGGNDFLVGNMDDNWNVFTYAVLIAPLILYYYGRQFSKRWMVLLLSVSTAMMVLISLKRIAILGLVAGNFFRFLFVPRVVIAIRVLLGVLMLLLIAMPLYEDLIRSRLEARSSRFEQGALERESRYVETFYVWDELVSFDNPAKSLFGLEGFNSVGNYANGRFGNRNLHTDYNLMANTIGIVGFCMYFMIFLELWKYFKRYYARATIDEESKKQLRATFYMLLITPFLTSFAGQMYHISYRLIVFVYLGAILGTLYQSANARTHSLQR
jgi:hypothetical protein